MTYVTHLESALDGTELDADELQTMHGGRPLWTRYDLARIAADVPRDEIARRRPSLWRYWELLPVADQRHRVTLGEGMTPLLRCERLGAELGLNRLWMKDESQLPTGSFKSRGLAVAVSRAKELGVRRLVIPTAGNAGGALAAYAARAGMEAWVFMPSDTPAVNQAEAAWYGARAFLVDGLIDDCAAIIASGTAAMDWFDVSTLKEPYRLEGKKTMGLELAEQMDWRLPGAILYPTGGGTGLIGMWKAFGELGALGWLDDDRLPRMYACQAAGCAPIVAAYEAGERFATRVPNAHTRASGLRVPAAVGDFMILDALRQSDGAAVAASDQRLLEWARRASALEGVSVCPETGACLAAAEDLVETGRLDPEEDVVVFNTGAAQKYLEVIRADLPVVSHPVDWDRLGG